MRFISPHPGLKVGAVGTETEVLASGQYRVLRRGYTAEFSTGDVTDYEHSVAREKFSFRGVPRNEDGSTFDPVPSRVSGFDTSKIKDAELRSQVEDGLLANTSFGQDFILCERPRLAPPWPTYDATKGVGAGNTSAKAIIERVVDLGINPDDVAAYERENRNRQDVLEALNALVAPSAENEETIVAA